MKRHQEGYAATGIVIILLALLIGAAGWYVYKTMADNDRNASQNQAAESDVDSTEESETVPAAENIVKIPELGIQITVADVLKNLTYTIRNGEYDEGTFIGADLSTAQLEALGAGCVSSNAPLGGLFRAEGQAPTVQETPTAQPPADKQFATFSISYSMSNGAACSGTAAITAELAKIGKVRDAILSIDLIE